MPHSRAGCRHRGRRAASPTLDVENRSVDGSHRRCHAANNGAWRLEGGCPPDRLGGAPTAAAAGIAASTAKHCCLPWRPRRSGRAASRRLPTHRRHAPLGRTWCSRRGRRSMPTPVSPRRPRLGTACGLHAAGGRGRAGGRAGGRGPAVPRPQRCLPAKQRVQFGQPLAGFQALKHRCAQMMVAVELARSAVLGGGARYLDAGCDARSAAGARGDWRARGRRGRAVLCPGGDPAAWRRRFHLGVRPAAVLQARPGQQPAPRWPVSVWCERVAAQLLDGPTA
jgi:hypothetical protein